MGLFSKLLGREERDLLEQELAQWAVASASDGDAGQVAVFRIRKSRPRRADLDAYRFAVSLVWEYDGPDGLPTPDLQAQMDELDRALDPLTGDNGYSELAMVATGLGAREWLFYVVNVERFQRAHRDATAGGWDWAVAVEVEEDPTWSRWREVVDGLSLGEETTTR